MIEASDEDSGVESVFMTDRKPHTLRRALERTCGTMPEPTVCFSLCSGLCREPLRHRKVENPYYKASLTEDETDESAVPEQSCAFTPDGSGTVLITSRMRKARSFSPSPHRMKIYSISS